MIHYEYLSCLSFLLTCLSVISIDMGWLGKIIVVGKSARQVTRLKMLFLFFYVPQVIHIHINHNMSSFACLLEEASQIDRVSISVVKKEPLKGRQDSRPPTACNEHDMTQRLVMVMTVMKCLVLCYHISPCPFFIIWFAMLRTMRQTPEIETPRSFLNEKRPLTDTNPLCDAGLHVAGHKSSINSGR